jgi:syndecan 4
VCDGGQDGDKDGIPDSLDNCPNEPNNNQNDEDSDGRGDVCDDDKDGDGVDNDTDNCPLVRNPGQEDANNNGVGDDCDGDWDGDGTTDFLDNCPNNSRVSITDFNDFQTIALDPHGSSQQDPNWVILNDGAEILETLNSDPGLAIGQDKLGGVDFEGTFFVNTYRDDDYVGFVFSYQSNSKFYVVMWKKSRQSYWEREPFTAIAMPGIQLKLVDSKYGPGTWLRNAMWHTGHTRDHVKLLWEDPEQQGWESKVAYRWLLIHRPKIGLIRLRIFKGQEVVADSGNIFDDTLKGGRLGVFCFSQEQLIWSDLSYNCREKLPEEVYNELSPELQNKVEVDEQLPWRVVGNSVRWSGSPKTSATGSATAKQATSRARRSLF